MICIFVDGDVTPEDVSAMQKIDHVCESKGGCGLAPGGRFGAIGLLR